MKRRIEQADDHIATGHGLEHRQEVLGLNLEQIGEGPLLHGLIVGQYKALDDVLTVAQEHVLGAAQANSLGAKLECELGILRVVGVDAHMVGVATGLVQANLVGPGQDGVQIASELGGDQVDGTVDDDAWVPSTEMMSPRAARGRCPRCARPSRRHRCGSAQRRRRRAYPYRGR